MLLSVIVLSEEHHFFFSAVGARVSLKLMAVLILILQEGTDSHSGTPGCSWNLEGVGDLGICLFPVKPLDVTQPNPSCSC